MRLWVSIVMLVLIACAVMASQAHKPFEMTIDAQSPGVWPKYASAPTEIPHKPEVICTYVYKPGQLQGGEKPISET